MDGLSINIFYNYIHVLMKVLHCTKQLLSVDEGNILYVKPLDETTSYNIMPSSPLVPHVSITYQNVSRRLSLSLLS